jgi:hypothetical protein
MRTNLLRESNMSKKKRPNNGRGPVNPPGGLMFNGLIPKAPPSKRAVSAIYMLEGDIEDIPMCKVWEAYKIDNAFACDCPINHNDGRASENTEYLKGCGFLPENDETTFGEWLNEMNIYDRMKKIATFDAERHGVTLEDLNGGSECGYLLEQLTKMLESVCYRKILNEKEILEHEKDIMILGGF